MSITEHTSSAPMPEPPDEWGDGPAAYEPGNAPSRPGDRNPPQDNAAEQSVLGSMLLSKDAIADVIEGVRGTDFYRPAHEVIFDAIIDLYGRGEPADPVTVTAELQRRGELQRVGGAPYLHTLSANVPIAANAGYYAEIVREKAILRRLVDAGTKIVQMGYAGEGQVDDVVDSAQAEVYKVTEKRAAEDYAPLSDIMEGVLDEIEAIGNRDGGIYGVPTGFADLDDLTNGFHSGQMIIVAARPAMGKALALDTPLPTPSGWTTMGEVAVGDQLYDAQGRPTRVVAATEVMHDRPCFEVEFSDGSVIVADGDHQWLTTPLSASRGEHPSVVEPGERQRARVETSLLAPLVEEVAQRRLPLVEEVAQQPSRNQGIRTTAQIAATIDHLHTITLPDGSMVKIESARPVRSVPVRCVQVDNPEHLYLAGPTAIPTHNSTLALDFCRAASIHNNLTSVFFSLEMNRSEITMRLLSAEAKVPLNHIRNGEMNDDDWAKLARKMGEVSSAPMFIDDSPNMTMMEIRAKARRLKQKHDLKLIVIDYMQLMTSGKKVESRQLEVSEFSRNIKLLAKELEVPVIALSQLNRGSEQRADKRPMMSDLRESGCLTADTRLMRADTNAEVTLGELLASGARDVPVWTLDERLKLVPRTLTHAFPSGVKPVFEMTLTSGRRIRATGNHKFLTVDGWMPLAELTVGSRIGSVRHVPPPLVVSERTHADVVGCAQSLSDGDFPVRWSADARLPQWVFSLPKRQLSVFLQHLWADLGDISQDAEGRGLIGVSMPSRNLADDVARLLLRFNVLATVGSREVRVEGADQQLRFLSDVGVADLHQSAADQLTASVRRERPETFEVEESGAVWSQLRDAMCERNTEGASRLGEMTAVLDRAEVDLVATNDVCWDAVQSVEPVGELPVYDATVMGLHNFVADGIAAHNSLEQDADMVILLHRDDAYEKESTRPGEADVIVAKHRNGPTRDVVVAFQGHYSRFVDMAH